MMNRRTLVRLLGASSLAALVLAARTWSAPAPAEQVIRLAAKKFEYSPNVITVKKGEPVVIEIVSSDRKHGFTIAALGIRSDVAPGKTNVVRFTPQTVGTFDFHCDLFCGSGHEGMAGTLVVVD